MPALPNDMELDKGPRSGGLERFCVATRAVRPVENLIRFVVAPDGQAVPDLKRKLPGRGVWVTATQVALDAAIKGNAFARGFKRDVRVARDLAAQTERLIERAALDALAIAGKTGTVVNGFARVEEALDRDDILALIHAADAAEEGRRKLGTVLHRYTAGKTREIVVIDAFTGAQLDLALNRLNVVHAALLAGPGSETFLSRAARLSRFRTGISTDAVRAHPSTGGA